MDFIEGEYRALDKRGITEATCRKFGYRVGNDNRGRVCQVADYRASDGELVAQKVRYADKTFSVVGGGGSKMPLFGQHLWAEGGKRLVITEGEIDAMSYAQATGLSWPAVSIPNGADGAAKSIKRALEWIETFEQVVFLFDMDEPGRDAAKECAALLTPGRAAIAELPLKDANDMLKANRVKELTTAVWQARKYRPDGIVSLDEIEERVLAKTEMGRPYCLPGVTKATFGRRPGEVIGLGGGTGCGKTDLFSQQVEFDVLQLGVSVGVLFLEQTVGETGRRIAGKSAGRRFHVPDDSWTEDELIGAWGRLKATNRLHLYDSWGAADWETLRSKIRYMVTSLGCEHIFLDHMTALAAAEDDERKALERIMAEIAQMANGLKFVLHYISHLATPEGKPHEEGGRVMIRHFKGSRALGYWSHFMFGLERDTQKPGSPAVLRCLKDRFTGQANGQTWGLSYDAASGLLSECELRAEGDFEDEAADDAPF